MEAMLQKTGTNGCFQIRHVTIVQSCRFITAIITSVMIFGLYDPGWRCGSRKHFTNQSTYHALYYDNHSSYLQPSLGNSTLRLNDSSGGYSYSHTCDVIDSCGDIEFNPTSSTIVTEFGLICDKVWIGHVIVSVLNGGMLVGAFVWGWVGERFGRRVGVYLSTLIMGIACALSVLSPIWEVYAVFSFFIGFGGIGSLTNLHVLTIEFLSSKWRGFLASMPTWNVGVMLLAFECYILKDWKQIHLVNGFLCGFICVGFFWTPESVRWLVLHQKKTQAKRVMHKIARINKRQISDDELNQFLFSNSNDTKSDENFTYFDLFKTAEIRSLTIKVSIVKMVASFVYDLIGFGLHALPGDFYLNIVVDSAIGLPAFLITALLSNSFGRRCMSISYNVLGTACCATVLIALVTQGGSSSSRVIDILITILALVSRSASQANIAINAVYVAELMPTSVRNLAFGFIFLSSKLTATLTPYLIPDDYTTMIIAFVVLAVAQLVATLLVASLPETKGKPLRDTILVQVNEDAQMKEAFDNNE